MQAPGLLPFTPLMKPPAGMDIESWLQQCVDATRSAPIDQRTQADLLCAISLFGSIVHNPQFFQQRIAEGLMQESKYYQLLSEKFTIETTIENTLALLEDQFQAEAVNALTPALRSVNDLQKLKQLHLEAAKVKSIETFAQMLKE